MRYRINIPACFQINNLRTQVKNTEEENQRLIKEGK